VIFTLIVCSIVSLVLTVLGEFNLAEPFLAVAIFFFAILIFLISSEKAMVEESVEYTKHQTEQPPLTENPELSAFRQAQDRYNTEAWNTNDFMEPPAIGGKRRP